VKVQRGYRVRSRFSGRRPRAPSAHNDGNQPCGGEDKDNHVSQGVDIEQARRERAAGSVVVAAEQARHPDARNQQGDEYRQRRDDDVVNEPTLRSRQRPAIDADHHRPVGRIEKRHAGRKQCGKRQDQPRGQAIHHFGRR
jgi:hypothetical protein